MGVYFASLDEGNGWVKFGDGRTHKTFVHGLRELKPHEWESVKRASGSGGARAEYLEVFDTKRSKSGTAYATGQAAFEHSFSEYESGARRYRKGYYNVLALRALSMLFHDASFEKPDNDNQIILMCTHAPQDGIFLSGLIDSIIGWSKVQTAGKTFYYNVIHVETVEEPVAGLFNYTMDADGKLYPQKEIWKQEGNVLVLDIGAYTSDFLRADQRGVPYPNGARSATAGVNKTKELFVEAMRHAHPDKFVNATDISSEQVEKAFTTIIRGKHYMSAYGMDIECDEQVRQATTPLLNQVLSIYRTDYGNGSGFGTILLDGGGCGLLHEVLREALKPHQNIHLVDVVKKIQVANARGAGKLLKLMYRKGAFNG